MHLSSFTGYRYVVVLVVVYLKLPIRGKVPVTVNRARRRVHDYVNITDGTQRTTSDPTGLVEVHGTGYGRGVT